jgi:hypothetical protein
MSQVKAIAVAVCGAFALASALPSTSTAVQNASVKAVKLVAGGVVHNAHACPAR